MPGLCVTMQTTVSRVETFPISYRAKSVIFDPVVQGFWVFRILPGDIRHFRIPSPSVLADHLPHYVRLTIHPPGSWHAIARKKPSGSTLL